MSKVNWNDKKGIITLLGKKYNIPKNEISRCFRQQLIKTMTVKELMTEIKNLTGNDVTTSQEEKALRVTLSTIVCGKYISTLKLLFNCYLEKSYTYFLFHQKHFFQ